MIVHSEMDCGCGCGFNNVDMDFLVFLNDAQKTVNEITGYYVPFKINSGCRCGPHNDAVGGSETSSHLTGVAADIAVRTSRERRAMLLAFEANDASRIGIGKNFLHVDLDPGKSPGVYWTYSH